MKFVQSLRQERELEDEDVKDTAEKLGARNQSLKAHLRAKQKDKQAAQLQLEKVRREVETGGLSEQARLQLWRGRITEAKSQLDKAKRESQKLEMQVAASLRQDD